MPWFIWMCFLTVPVSVGVAYTLAVNTADDPKRIQDVAIAGGVWLFVAYHLKNHLRDRTPIGQEAAPPSDVLRLRGPLVLPQHARPEHQIERGRV